MRAFQAARPEPAQTTPRMSNAPLEVEERLNQSASVQAQIELGNRLNQTPRVAQLVRQTEFANRVPRHPVAQLKEPYDSQAKEAWNDKIEEITDWAQREHHTGIPVSFVARYMEEQEGIASPDDRLDFDSEAEVNEFISSLGRVDAGEVYGSYMRKKEKKKIYEVLDTPDSVSDDDDRYYSSEDDETPEDRGSFDRTIQVIRALDGTLDDLPGDVEGRKKFREIIERITAQVKARKRVKRARTASAAVVVPIERPTDWLAFAEEARRAKATETKPTVYDIDFPIWPEARYRRIPFRGRQLKDAEGGQGRSWPAIAQSLHDLALVLADALADIANDDDRANVGNRALATAMLYVLAGRGNEVKGALSGLGLDKDKLAAFEKVILEFFALTAGVESIRLPFAQLDTVLHLSNIAQGNTFGTGEQRYDFRNVFSSVRGTKEGPKHVFSRGSYIWRPNRDSGELEIFKEITRYQGHSLAEPEESGNRPTEMGRRKSAKSVGKSGFSHSAGHGRLEKLFAGNSQVIEALWQQVRPVDEDEESRRSLHADRLFVMGPVRAFNLVANLLARHEKALAKAKPAEIADLFIAVYRSFLTGERPDSENPFANELPTVGGPDFSTSLLNILQEEEVETVDEDLAGALEGALTRKDEDALDGLFGDAKKVAGVLAFWVRGRHKLSGESPLHAAVLSGSERLVRGLIQAGADLSEEDEKGQTPLTLALNMNAEKIVEILVEAQDQQAKKNAKLPAEWARFSRLKVGGNWLRDDEVRAGVQAANLANTYVAPAVDISEHPEALAEFIRDNYLEQIGAGGVEEYTVVPVNFNNAHWATLIIRQNPLRRSQPFVYFFDSLGADEEKLLLLREMLRMTGVYTRTDNLVDLSDDLQEDGYTCGTWLIQSATTIVQRLQDGTSLDNLRLALRNLGVGIEELHTQTLALRPSSSSKKKPKKKETQTPGPRDETS
ncbi:MAG TPA: ankyrin repeat domain-containing protein [Thermoanaerobaculia bacterium]